MIIGTITFQDQQVFVAQFDSFARVFEDSRSGLEHLGGEVLAMGRRRIDRQGYEALSEGYAKLKAKKYPSKPILRASDDLYNSLQKDATDNIFRVTALDGEFGTAKVYALAHQEGKGRLPVREIFDIRTDDEAALEERLMNNYTERLQKLGADVS